MNAARITAAELFEQQVERLDLRWLAGQREAGTRVLEAVETVARRPSLAGYLNIIYPNKLQILGTEELSWLDGLDSRQRWETIQKIIDFRPLAVVISMGSVGLPGQVSFMATNMPVTQALGLPVEPLGLLLALDTIPDVFATLGNVTGDLTATTVVAKGQHETVDPGAPVEPQA